MSSTVVTEEGHKVIFRGWDLGKSGTVISAVRAARLIAQGCEAFWCYAMMERKSLTIEEILVACEFVEVFSDDLPGLPPQRSVDFSIELESGTRPISKAPYRMASIELLELKK